MPLPKEPARGIIIPFPIEAIRRMPTPAFVTQPKRPPRFPARGPIVLAVVTLASLLVGVLAGIVLVGAARQGAAAAMHRRLGSRAARPGPGARG